MSVVCKVMSCPFKSLEGFCSNPTVSIDENGHCAFIWYRGSQRALEPINETHKKKIIILEVEDSEE